MDDLSHLMTAEQFCTLFHQALHLHDTEECLEIAEMYGKCKRVENHMRSAMFWCRMARVSDNGSFKKRSSALMRTIINELSDEDMDCVDRSLVILANVLHDAGCVPPPMVALQNLEGYFSKSNSEIEIPKRRIEKPQPATLILVGHGRWASCGGLCHSLSADAWRLYLSGATFFGWKPGGTRAPGGYRDMWYGSYYPAEGQEVAYQDARELRLALERLVNAARSGDKMTEEQSEAVEVLQCFDNDLSGAQDLADFALDGPFCVFNNEAEWFPDKPVQPQKLNRNRIQTEPRDMIT